MFYSCLTKAAGGFPTKTDQGLKDVMNGSAGKMNEKALEVLRQEICRYARILSITENDTEKSAHIKTIEALAYAVVVLAGESWRS